MRPDSLDYLRLAANLAAGHGFSQSDAAPYLPDTARTPVYPALLAGLRLLFGPSLLPILLAQILITGIACGLTYLLGLRLLPERAARAGAILQALCPGAIVYSHFVMTESLFTLLLLATVLLVARCAARQGRPDDPAAGLALLGAGLLGGVAVLCRPIALGIPVVLAAIVAASGRGIPGARASAGDDAPSAAEAPAASGAAGLARRGVSLRLVAAALLLAASSVVVAPWALRNARTLGAPSVSSMGTYNLLFYEAAAVKARVEKKSEAEARAELARTMEQELSRRERTQEENPFLAGTDHRSALLAERLRLYNDRGRRILARHPLAWARAHLEASAVGLLPNITEALELLGIAQGGRGTLDVMHREGLGAGVARYTEGRGALIWWIVPAAVVLGLVYAAALLGVVDLARRRQGFALALLALPALYLLLVPGPTSHPRFRVPAMPYLDLLAGVGLIAAFRRPREDPDRGLR